VAEPLEPAGLTVDGSAVEWRRVSGRYLAIDLVGTAVLLVLLEAATVPLHLLELPFAWPASIAVLVLCAVIAGLTPRRVRAIGYLLREDDLVFRRGLLQRKYTAVPYGRMQLVDINRGPLARLAGLSELRLVTAAAATQVVIPGLPEADAEQLRDHLVAVAESRRAGL